MEFTFKRLLLLPLLLMLPLLAMAQGWPADYKGVMLQAFYYENVNHSAGWTGKNVPYYWSALENRSDEFSKYFDLIWIINSGSLQEEDRKDVGYQPIHRLTHNTIFGTQQQLMSMISTFKSKGTGIIEDVVVNHQETVGSWGNLLDETATGTQSGNLGKEYKIEWCHDYTNMWGVVSDDELFTKDNGIHPNDPVYQYIASSEAHPDYYAGDGEYGRDLDHYDTRVQANVMTYLDFLREELGYCGFRYDVAKGYDGQVLAKYNIHSRPMFSVGEYWPNNYDSPQTEVGNWLERTTLENGAIQSAAFDFPLKIKLRDAINSGNWAKLTSGNFLIRYNGNKYKRYAVTFAENHDTTRGGDRLTKSWTAANAFILALPGTPCIFIEHYEYDKPNIQQMILARRAAGVSNTSNEIGELTFKTDNGYQVTTQGDNCRVCAQLGDAVTSTLEGYTRIAYSAGNSSDCAFAYWIENAYADKLEANNYNKPGLDFGYAMVSKKSGSYYQSVSVDIEGSTSNTQLVYTTDGSEPNESSTLISAGTKAQLTFTTNTTLKVGVLSNGQVKNIETYNYRVTNRQQNEITVYVKANRTPVWFYSWYDIGAGEVNPAGTWGGTQIDTKGTKHIGDADWYYFTVQKPSGVDDFSFNCILHNNNGSKSADIMGVNSDIFYELNSSYVPTDVTTDELLDELEEQAYSVSFDKSEGNYIDDVTVTMTAAIPTSTIVYTTDGTQPTTSSPLAVGSKALTFDETTTLTAGVLYNNKVVNTISRTYTIISEEDEEYLKPIDYSYVVYVQADEAPYIHAWQDGGEEKTQWPGEPFSEQEEVDGRMWWKKNFSDADQLNVVIHNNKGGESNQKRFDRIPRKAFFTYDGGSGGENVTADYTDVDPYEYYADAPDAVYVDDSNVSYCYFEKPWAWGEDLYVWSWDGNGNYYDAWPGSDDDLTCVGYSSNGNDVYRWQINGTAKANIIFNAGSGKPQTADLPFVNGGYYTAAGLEAVVNRATLAVYRNFVAGAKSTICLPFGVKADEMDKIMGKVYELTEYDENGYLIFNEVTKMKAYRPYVLIPLYDGIALSELKSKKLVDGEAGSVVAGDFSFIGTKEKLNLKSTDDMTYFGYSQGSFVQIGNTNGVDILPWRAYFGRPSSSNAPLIDMLFDESTGIGLVKGNTSPVTAIYDLQGRKINASQKLSKGIYIINGKKMMVK